MITIKSLIILFLAILLISCSSSSDLEEQKEESKVKEVTLKIEDEKENQYYYITVEFDGRQISNGETAKLLQPELLITNGNKEVTVVVNLNTTCTIRVARSKVKSMEDLMRKRMDGDGANLIGPLLKTIKFTPKKGTSTLKISLEE